MPYTNFNQKHTPLTLHLFSLHILMYIYSIILQHKSWMQWHIISAFDAWTSLPNVSNCHSCWTRYLLAIIHYVGEIANTYSIPRHWNSQKSNVMWTWHFVRLMANMSLFGYSWQEEVKSKRKCWVQRGWRYGWPVWWSEMMVSGWADALRKASLTSDEWGRAWSSRRALKTVKG